MKFSTHHDAPVAFPNSMRVLDATVTRRSRSGDIIGPAQRVDVMTALKAMTIGPAWQHFEDDTKGSLEVGKLADFVILDKNPLEVDPENLDQIKVVETIKEGVTVFDIEDMKKASASLEPGGVSELVFTRAILLASLAPGQGHQDYSQGNCYCNALSRIAAAMAGGEGR
jgi:hypothetical protein